MEKTITKEQIATYLRDFAYTFFLALQEKNENKPFLLVYEDFLNSDGRKNEATIDEFYKMIYFASSFVNIRLISVMYDNFFQFITEEELKKLNVNLDEIFINKEDSKLFENKKRLIISTIRNAINHNDVTYTQDDNSTHYKLYININIPSSEGKYPFNLKLDPLKLVEIMTAIIAKSNKVDMTVLGNEKKVKDSLPLSQRLKDYFIVRIHPKTKSGFTKEQRKKIEELFDSGKSSQDIINYLEDSATVEKYNLSWEEVYTILNRYKQAEKVIFKDNSKTKIIKKKDLLKFEILNTIPLGIFKAETLLSYLYIIYNINCTNTLKQASMETYFKQNPNIFSKIPFSEVYTLGDLYSNKVFGFFQYFCFMFDTIIPDDTVTINGQEYSKHKIRNSLVHMRYFHSDNKLYFKGLSSKLGQNQLKKISNELVQESVLTVDTKDMIKTVEEYFDKLVRKQETPNDKPPAL